MASPTKYKLSMNARAQDAVVSNDWASEAASRVCTLAIDSDNISRIEAVRLIGLMREVLIAANWPPVAGAALRLEVVRGAGRAGVSIQSPTASGAIANGMRLNIFADWEKGAVLRIFKEMEELILERPYPAF